MVLPRRVAKFFIVNIVIAIIIVGVITIVITPPACSAAAAAAAVAALVDDRQRVEAALFHKSAALARETLDRALSPPHHALPEEHHLTANTLPEDDDNDNDKNLSYDGSDLIEWINANGGFIHENARIGLDPTGKYRGVFVKNRENANIHENESTREITENNQRIGGGEGSGSIEEGDIIARIPWDLIIKPNDYAENNYWSCEAIHELYRQFQLGDESKYAPYINYLKNQPGGRIPSEWTMEGKQLLNAILDRTPNNNNNNHESKEENGLPPQQHLKGYEETWIQECHGEDTPLARAAFYQFTSRDEDTLMVPFYDMHNHSNDPKKLNTISHKPKRKGRPFILRAIRDILPGEQIYISYNRCHRCWFDEEYKDCTSYSHYGTSEVFDIFGFVEDYPQMWTFRMKIENEEDGGGDDDDEKKHQWDELKFCLERNDDNGDDDDDDKRLVVTFGDNYVTKGEEPTKANIKYLAVQLIRLHELELSMENDQALMKTMPRYEWDTAWNYHQALMTSISAAMLASDLLTSEDGESTNGEGRDEL